MINSTANYIVYGVYVANETSTIKLKYYPAIKILDTYHVLYKPSETLWLKLNNGSSIILVDNELIHTNDYVEFYGFLVIENTWYEYPMVIVDGLPSNISITMYIGYVNGSIEVLNDIVNNVYSLKYNMLIENMTLIFKSENGLAIYSQVLGDYVAFYDSTVFRQILYTSTIKVMNNRFIVLVLDDGSTIVV